MRFVARRPAVVLLVGALLSAPIARRYFKEIDSHGGLTNLSAAVGQIT